MPDQNKPSKIILIAEDDEDDREMLGEIFAAIDNSITLFFIHNGKELLPALENSDRQHLPSLIILDYNMPGSNAAEMLEELGTKERFGNIPKIVWSTSGSDKFKNRCLALGAKDYISKPSTMKELEKAVNYMIGFCKKNGE